MERRRCKSKPLIQLKKTLEKQEEIIAEYQRYVEDTYIDVRITLQGQSKSRRNKMRVSCNLRIRSIFLLTFNFIALH